MGGLGRLGWLLILTGCGEFGLPSGQQEGQVVRGDPTVVDVNPKVGSVGTSGLEVTVTGVDTFFDESTEVELPELPQILITSISPASTELMVLSLDIPTDTPYATSPLVVITERDGRMVYEDGFTTVH